MLTNHLLGTLGRGEQCESRRTLGKIKIKISKKKPKYGLTGGGEEAYS